MADAPEDDLSIIDDTVLWRRIHPDQWIPDAESQFGYRVTSEIFSDPELSVVIAAECTLERLMEGHADFGVAEFTAGDVRQFGWGVVRRPDLVLPGHCHVTGKNKQQKKRSRLAKSCRIVRAPTIRTR
jgi:hypothetical protein